MAGGGVRNFAVLFVLDASDLLVTVDFNSFGERALVERLHQKSTAYDGFRRFLD